MLPRTKRLLCITHKTSSLHPIHPISSQSTRNCISGVNSPYFQIEHAPWVYHPVWKDTAKTEPFPVFRCIDLDGNTCDPNFILPFPDTELIEMYRNMNLVSYFDDTMYRLARAGYFSFYMQNTGEEALTVGSGKAWHDGDVLFLQYRELGTLLQRGFDIQKCADQCFSTQSDGTRGRGMPVHYTAKEINAVSISSPLATQMPQASGAAYALKRSGQPNIVICYFGDGAASEGDAHVALNFSATTETPIIWFCKNNGYAISTPTKEQYRGDGIAARAYGYGMIVHRFDGNDLLASYISSRDAREMCVAQQRPILLEAMSYRASHHSTSDDSKTYRCSKEEEEWRIKYNPIRRLRVFMEKELLWTDRQEKELLDSVNDKIDKAVTIARNALKPNWRHVITETYDRNIPRLKQQMHDLEQHLKIYGDETYYELHQFSDKFHDIDKHLL